MEKTILEETKRFVDALPQLLQRYAHRWIVFKNGEVVSDHANEEEAYALAVARFGVSGGFVVAPVENVHATPVSAGVMFGLA